LSLALSVIGNAPGFDAAKAKGVCKGRPATFDRARIVALRKEGMGAMEIAKAVGFKRGASIRRSKPQGLTRLAGLNSTARTAAAIPS
jgi:hypothetical protein